MSASTTPTSTPAGTAGGKPAGRAEMEQRLLDAALDILQTDGAAALTVRNITERAGCSTTGIYTYFGGKHGLIDAIYLDGFRSFGDALAGAYTAPDLVDACLRYREWALANPMHYLVMFGRAVPDFKPGAEAYACSLETFTALTDAVDRAGAADPGEAAYHLYATAHGYVMLELVAMDDVAGRPIETLYRTGIHRTLHSLGLGGHT